MLPTNWLLKHFLWATFPFARIAGAVEHLLSQADERWERVHHIAKEDVSAVYGRAVRLKQHFHHVCRTFIRKTQAVDEHHNGWCSADTWRQ